MQSRERRTFVQEWIFKPLLTAAMVVVVGGSVMAMLSPNTLVQLRDVFSRLREPGPHREPDRALSPSLLAELSAGGFTLFVRHASRDPAPSLDAIDRAWILDPASVPADFRQGFCLNELGRIESRLLGQFIRESRIPIGEVLSSPLCRARETAELSVGRVDRLDFALVHAKVPAPGLERSVQREGIRSLMKQPPAPGTNRILFGHWDTMDKRDFGEVKLEQAGMAIFQHSGSGLKLRATVDLIDLMHALPSPRLQQRRWN